MLHLYSRTSNRGCLYSSLCFYHSEISYSVFVVYFRYHWLKVSASCYRGNHSQIGTIVCSYFPSKITFFFLWFYLLRRQGGPEFQRHLLVWRMNYSLSMNFHGWIWMNVDDCFLDTSGKTEGKWLFWYMWTWPEWSHWVHNPINMLSRHQVVSGVNCSLWKWLMAFRFFCQQVFVTHQC